MGYRSRGCKESDVTERLSAYTLALKRVVVVRPQPPKITEAKWVSPDPSQVVTFLIINFSLDVLLNVRY